MKSVHKIHLFRSFIYIESDLFIRSYSVIIYSAVLDLRFLFITCIYWFNLDLRSVNCGVMCPMGESKDSPACHFTYSQGKTYWGPANLGSVLCDVTLKCTLIGCRLAWKAWKRLSYSASVQYLVGSIQFSSTCIGREVIAVWLWVSKLK